MRISYIFSILLFVCVSTADSFSQEVWTKYFENPVLTPGSAGEWDDAGFAGQSVFYDSTDGIYKMWYGASDGSNFRIGYATSTDGIDWAKYNDPSTTDPPYAESDPVLGLGPGSFESVRVYFPIVYFDGTTYYIWYSGSNGSIERVGYATSPDGIAWVKDTLHNPVITTGSSGSWDDMSVGPGPVQYDGTTFEMIYNGFDGAVYQAGYATSTDGFTWDKGNVVLPVGSSTSWDYPRATPTSVVYNPYLSKYYMFYSGGEFGYWKIGYAKADLFEGPWTKNPSVLMEGTLGEWDAVTTAFPSVLYFPDDSLYKMWYMGSNTVVGPSGGKIGYATAPPENIPVELNSFTASTNGKEVILYWTTATELNNLGFEIQRSSDSIEFITIGFIQGNGTTTQQQRYTYSDKNLANGTNFYRLKQVDFNGNYEYSEVVEVVWKAFKSYLLEQNYPNPFNPATTIGYGLNEKGMVNITVFNSIGEEATVILNEEKEAGYHQVEFNAADLPSGVYFYQIKADSYVETKKMILLK